MNPVPIVTDTPERLYVPMTQSPITPGDVNFLASEMAVATDANTITYTSVPSGGSGNSTEVRIVDDTSLDIGVAGTVITVNVPISAVAAQSSHTFGAGTVGIAAQTAGVAGNGFQIKLVKPLSTTTTSLSSSQTGPQNFTINLAVDGSTDVLANVTTALSGSNNDLVFTSKLPGTIGNNITVAYVAPLVASATTAAKVNNYAVTVTLAASAGTASLTTSLTGTNNDMVFTSKLTGSTNGNKTTITYRDPAANNATLSISFSGDDIIVNLATGPGGAITSTAALIKAALEANSVSNALITIANAGGNDGSGVVTALAKTALAGGGVLTVTSTAAQVTAAIAANAESNALLTVANAAANDGTGIVTAGNWSLTNGVYASVTTTVAQLVSYINSTFGTYFNASGTGTTTAVVSEYTFLFAGGQDANTGLRRNIVDLINSDPSASALVIAYTDPKTESMAAVEDDVTLSGGLDGQWGISQKFARGFTVGTGGDVHFLTYAGDEVTKTYQDGEREETAIIRVYATGTTATGIVGLA